MAKKKRGSRAVSPVRWQQAAPVEGESARRGPGWGPYLAPWITCAGMIPAGWLAHWWWGEAGLATGLAAAAIAAAGAAVTWVDHRLTKARSWWAHDASTVSVAAATVWLATAVAFGPGRPVLDVLLIGGIAMATASNLHTWAARQGGGEEDSPREVEGRVLPALPPWRQVCQRLGLVGVRMRVTDRSEVRTQARLEAEPGQTLAQVTAAKDELASAYDVAPSGVRVVQDPASARRGELTIVHTDVLGELLPWPGLRPEEVGASIADAPITHGVYEDGEPFTDAMVNDGGLPQTMVMGMSGSGKSMYAKIKAVSIAARRDTFTVAIDLSKGKQSLKPIGGALGWYALNNRQAARAVLAGVKRAVDARADWLGEHGYAQWTKGCGLAYLYVLLEEAADLEDVEVLAELARTARSAGVKFDFSLQRATWDNMDTSVRAQLGDGVCFGVRDEGDADLCLPDYVTEAGAAPHQWRKTKPGAAFAAVEAQDAERHATPVKMYGPPVAGDPARENDTLIEACAALEEQDARLDDVTRRAFGQAYAEFVAARRVPAAATVTVTEIPDDEDDQDDAMDMDEELEQMSDEEVFDTPDPDPDLVADIDDEMPAPEADMELPPPPEAPKGSRESAEVARQRLAVQLQAWHAQGRGGFRAAEMGAALAEFQGVHRSRSWVIGELQRLAAAGGVRHEDDGTFTILQPDPEVGGRELAGV